MEHKITLEFKQYLHDKPEPYQFLILWLDRLCKMYIAFYRADGMWCSRDNPELVFTPNYKDMWAYVPKWYDLENGLSARQAKKDFEDKHDT